MDSAGGNNTASLQSSSGNDDFDSSTAQSISSFFNPPSNFPPLHPHPHRPNINPNNNSNNFFHDSSSLYSSHTTFTPPPTHLNFPSLNPSPSSTFFPIHSPPPHSISHHKPIAAVAPSSSDNLHAVVKNPKKRTRASRRAPTTVLTTDTSNFRQMVQEFTGIPSSPFSAASPYTRRLDLFSSPSSSAGLRQFDTLGPLYSLRPQFHPPPPPNPNLNSTMIDSIVPSTSMINPNSITNPPDHMLTLHNSLQLGGFGNGGEDDDDDDEDGDGDDENDENLRRWKSGETVRRRRNDDDDGEEENVETRTAYDHHGNIDNIRSHHHNQQQQQQQQHQISEMNLKNLADKGTIGSAANGGGGVGVGGSSSSGTVAPWIFPTQ